MSKRNHVRLNSKLPQPEFKPGSLSERQLLYVNGIAINNDLSLIEERGYICPSCGNPHIESYKALDSSYYCLKCKTNYLFPRFKKVKYTKPNIFSKGDKIPVEIPDWKKY